MKKLIVIIFSFIMSCSSVSFSSEKGQLLKEMAELKKIEKKNINSAFALFVRAGKSMEKEIDPKIISEVGRLLQLTFKIDSNYYTVEPFSGVIEKNEKAFLMELKKVLPKKDYQTLQRNIELMKKEMTEGNG